MSSLKHFRKIDSLTQQLAAQGMRMEPSKTHSIAAGVQNQDIVSIYPDRDGLPHYDREAELFIGTLDDVEIWISGIQWVTAYYKVLGVDSGSRRVRKEQAERERQLLHALDTGQLPKLKK